MTRVVASVRGMADAGTLAITPVDSGDGALRRLLAERLPDVRRRRNGSSQVIGALDAVPILDWPDGDELLRFDEVTPRMLRNRRRALANHGQVHEEIRQLKSHGIARARELLAGHTGLEVLDDHQWVNVAAMSLPGCLGLCLFDEQGAGKTVTVVHAVDVLAERRQVMTTLVVAPKSMLGEWQRDIGRFMGDLYRVELLIGPKQQRLAILATAPDIVVCNFETVVSMESELRSYVRRFDGHALLVVDESFNVKNDAARRTRAVRRLREEFDRAAVLCGTPAPNAPHDIIAQFDLVDFGITFRGVQVPDDRDAAVPVVREAMEKRGLYTRHLKHEVLPDLPGKTFHRVGVTLAPHQQRAYVAALNDLILDLRATDDDQFARSIVNYLARRAALLRICSDPGGVVRGYSETPAKFLALDELLEDWIGDKQEKVVLWSFYTNTVEALTARYARFSPVRYDGSVSNVADRREAVRRFQDDDKTMLFVGNAGAGGAGLTLHRARLAVYESLSNQAAHFLQSVDRIHRRGQDREVEYVMLLSDGSIEEGEFDRLLDKEARSRDLLGDTGNAPVTRASMLSELASSAARLGLDVSA